MNKCNENPTRALLIEFNDWIFSAQNSGTEGGEGRWGSDAVQHCQSASVRDIDDHEVETEAGDQELSHTQN